MASVNIKFPLNLVLKKPSETIRKGGSKNEERRKFIVSLGRIIILKNIRSIKFPIF